MIDFLVCVCKRERIPKGQFRETGNTGYTRRRKTTENHNTLCVGYQYAQTNTNDVIKT